MHFPAPVTPTFNKHTHEFFIFNLTRQYHNKSPRPTYMPYSSDEEEEELPFMGSAEDAHLARAALRERETFHQRMTQCMYRSISEGEAPVDVESPFCQARFESKKAMDIHKHEDPTHFYCRKCDLDFEDWEALTKHKVDIMAPFIEGRMRPSKGNMPKHIVCEFCGETFKSFEGRKTHRAKNHQAEQDIRCPGCSSKFVRASDMIAHIEYGNCSEISFMAFYIHMQHKYIREQIRENHHQFATNINTNVVLNMRERLKIADEEEDADQEEGGVQLIDALDEGQMGGYKALSPERVVTHYSSMPTPTNLTLWPKISKTPPSIINEPGGIETQLPFHRSTGSIRAGVLAQSRTSQPLDPETEQSTKAALVHWEGLERQARGVTPANDCSNVLDWKGWDPKSKEYNPDQFLDPTTKKYCCPFPACADYYQVFDLPTEFHEHFRVAHFRTVYACPVCHKRTETISALIGHIENTRRCRIRDSIQFEKFLDDITGGFLKGKRVAEPAIFRPDKALVVRIEKEPNGIMNTRYTGKDPYEE